jgi:hypothetical protein
MYLSGPLNEAVVPLCQSDAEQVHEVRVLCEESPLCPSAPALHVLDVVLHGVGEELAQEARAALGLRPCTLRTNDAFIVELKE